MEHYLAALSGHQLRTNSLKELAKDLSDRLDISIAYGYTDKMFIEGISNGDKEFVTLGKIDKGDINVWKLNQYFYLDKIKDPYNFENNVFFTLYLEHENSFPIYFKIFYEFFVLKADYQTSWLELSFSIICNITEFRRKENDYRKIVYEYTTLLGGKSAIYFDYKDTDFILERIYSEPQKLVKNIDKKLKERLNEDYINISDFPKKRYDPTMSNNSSVPITFYDDFNFFRKGKWESQYWYWRKFKRIFLKIRKILV